MALSFIVLAFIFIIGLCIGSFLNVVILRTVSGESIAFPGSKCPKCQTPLKWYHNIPVFSYIFLRGKCAFCKEHISIQYPIVELITAILFTILFIKFCIPFDPISGLRVLNPIHWTRILLYIFVLIVAGLLIAITGTDIIEQKVADIHTNSLIGAGIIYSILISIINVIFYTKALGFPKFGWAFILNCPVLYSIASAILGFLIIESIARLGIWITGTRAFGEGDSYIFAGLGAVFGGMLASSYIYAGNYVAPVRLLTALFVIAVVLQVVFTFPIFVKKLIKEKNWMTLGLLSAFIIYAIAYAMIQSSGLLENKFAYWCSTIVFAGLGIFACKELLSGIRENKESGLYLPFGPALVVSGIIALLILPF